jgi:quercetin dioxygenase-like cupin family protein
VAERRLVTPDQSACQNIVLVDTEAGAQVEMHSVTKSESFYFLSGRFVATTPDERFELRPGSLIYFPPGASHGLSCVEGPGQYLVVFAPRMPL